MTEHDSEAAEHMDVQVGAEGIDVEALVAEIRAEVDRKRRDGVYNDALIGRAERHNLSHLSDSGELLAFYLGLMRDGGVVVDINDYTITDRRTGPAGRLLVKLKKTIWSLLKFYTYRLWRQQNLINGQLVTAIDSHMKHTDRKIAALEARVAELEKGSGS